MNTKNKKILQETSRWLRVGFLTVTVLGPVVKTLSSLLRKRGKKAQRELAKRTEQLTQQQTRQSSPLWAVSSFSIGLIAAGIAAYLLVKKRLQQQGSQQEHFSQNGYLNGTTQSTTGREIYSSQPTFKTAEPANGASSVRARIEPIIEPLIVKPELDEYEAETEKMPAISLSGIVKKAPTVEETPVLQAETLEQQDAEATEQRKPAATLTDAAFLGVVGTQHYYPIETPLNELQAAEGGTVDVIYFATEDEAKAQGYTSL